jgi:tripartite-type tricarboxylate transporter receptor subunit TctC
MKKLLTVLIWSAALLAPSAGAQATDYPTKPIKFIVPFPAGSGTDASARFVGQGITAATGQAVVVDNKAGADGLIAAQAAARSPADGYTVFVTTMTTQSVNPHLHKKLPYDPVKDFVPVSLFTRSPMLMVVRNAPDQPKTLAEHVAHARKQERGLNFGTGNTSSRIGAELYARQAGLKATRLPYRGTPQALTDLLAGQIDFMWVDLSPAVPLVKAGKLRALAVTAPQRLDTLPEVPTTAEAGFPDIQLYTWSAAFVPAGTPKPVVEKLNGLIQATLKTPEAAEYYGKNGIGLTPMTLAESAAFVAAEYESWRRAVRLAGIEPE